MLSEYVCVLQSYILCVIEFLKGNDTLLDRFLGQEISISSQPIHDIHFVSQIDAFAGAEKFDPVCGMLIDEPLNHVVQRVCFLNQSLNFLTRIRSPVNLRSQVGKRFLLVFDLNNLILYSSELFVQIRNFLDLFVAKLNEFIFNEAKFSINLSHLVKRVVGDLLEDNINVIDLANLNFLESQEVYSEDVHISLQLFYCLFEVLEIKLLVKGLKSLRNEIVLKSLNTNHQVLLELILPLHERLLSSVHALNNIDLLSHGFFKLFHPLGVNSVTVFEILRCS